MRFYPHERRFFFNNLAEPLTPGAVYLAEIFVDSVTIMGAVHMMANSTATEPVRCAGRHRMVVRAGMITQNFGVFGEYTDAVIDRVSIRQIIFQANKGRNTSL